MAKMDMNLTKLTLAGVKNLHDEIVLDFAPKNIIKTTNLHDYNVKSIYGMNGIGKSGIIQAVNIYKNLLEKKSTLYDKDSVRYIYEMINKKRKEMKIEIEFLSTFYSDRGKVEYTKYIHEIILATSNNEVVIKKEKLAKKKKSPNSKEKILFLSEKGEYISGEISENFQKQTINLLDSQSVIRILYGADKTVRTENIEIFIFHMFSRKLIIDRALEDEHEKRVFIDFSDEKSDEENKNETGSHTMYFRNNLVHKTYVEKYKEHMHSVEKFIKLFKSPLKKIDLKFKKVDDDFYEVDRYFIYDDYSINYEYESTGIKKLIGLYNDVKAAEQGKIVFIDEFDANINDIYLIKLVDYLARYTKGQVIFTTHNVSPMKVLRNKKKAIDFLNLNGQIISSIKNGNYSLENLYRDGMINGLPFNIETYEFASIFSSEEE